jgi:hypothetical protein
MKKCLSGPSGMTSILRNSLIQDDLFIEVAENGHIKILELAERKELDWYDRKILVGATARNDRELLDFFLNKKPTKFNLSFTRMCVREGFIEALEWWKNAELIALFADATYSGQLRMLDSLYENEYQQAPYALKQILNETIVNGAAGDGIINTLKWAHD